MKIYLVGGAVRDKLLKLPVKEKDWVVVGATVDEMLALGYKQVGKEFPVFIHPKTGEEYALARTERKVKPGYQGFTFDTSSAVTLEEDLERRDLTINAMAEDAEGKVIDPYRGESDLQQKILRHVSNAFAEDPVRILRVGRFLARYAHLGFAVAPETLALMKDMVSAKEVHALVAERVWKELERALSEKNPEKFFIVLEESGALAILFPDLTLTNKGMAALLAATQLTPKPIIRFSALFYTYPKEQILELSRRYRIPTAYRELAILTASHHSEILHTQIWLAPTLLQLLTKLDVFRREERFNDFLIACKAISLVEKSSFDIAWFVSAAQIAKSVDVQKLLAKGLTGIALAQHLKKEREEKIAQWLNGLL